MSAREWASGGCEAFQNGKLVKAKGLFSRAAEQDPNDFRVRANLARTIEQSGDRQEAILHMQQAVDLSNGDPRLRLELGEMYLAAGQWFPARRQVQLLLESNNRNAPAWALSGKTHKAKGKYQEALADFQKALGYEPELEDVQMQIVETYGKIGQPLRALSAVEQVLSKYPVDDQPEQGVLAKSVALMELKQIGPAIDLLETASQKERPSSEVFVRLSNAQILAGQESQARLTLNRGKEKFPHLAVFDQLANELQSGKKRVASMGGAFPSNGTFSR
ncbi:MAG: tetratricopeptide repeat protein [Mariniblastus sp.]